MENDKTKQEKKVKEFLEGKRSFIFFITTTIFFAIFIWQGKGIEAYWTWALTCSVWLGKNYFSSKLNQ